MKSKDEEWGTQQQRTPFALNAFFYFIATELDTPK